MRIIKRLYDGYASSVGGILYTGDQAVRISSMYKGVRNSGTYNTDLTLQHSDLKRQPKWVRFLYMERTLSMCCSVGPDEVWRTSLSVWLTTPFFPFSTPAARTVQSKNIRVFLKNARSLVTICAFRRGKVRL